MCGDKKKRRLLIPAAISAAVLGAWGWNYSAHVDTDTDTDAHVDTDTDTGVNFILVPTGARTGSEIGWSK